MASTEVSGRASADMSCSPKPNSSGAVFGTASVRAPFSEETTIDPTPSGFLMTTDHVSLDQELVQIVESLIADELERRFGDRFVFDPIRVTEKYDLDDNPYLRVEIVFHGGTEHERLKELAKGALGLITAVGNRVAEKLGTEDLVLLPSYIEKSEWDEVVAAV